jgi:hypothetical protein
MLIISPEARIYALRELVRRAGVEPSFFAEWRIESGQGRTRLWITHDKLVDFPHASPEFWCDIDRGEFRVEHAAWCYSVPADLARQIPYFVIPFADREVRWALFRVLDERHAECSVDLLSSLWLTLSRFEETLAGERDAHDRFTAAQSLAFKGGFLDRPVVDEFGLAFEQVLKALLPGWRPNERKLQVKVSHDIDVVGIPVQWRTTLGHVLSRRNPQAALRDILSTVASVRPAYLQAVLDVVNLAAGHGLRSAVYWKTNEIGPLDSAYDLRHPKLSRTLTELMETGAEMGVHPGYKTFLNPEKLRTEVETLRNVLGEREFGGRQHFLRWSPATWYDWEQCGLGYDSSVGFADHIGFRAGTCFPYRPWLLDRNREADLLEIPLIVMDGTFTVYMKLAREKSLDIARACIDRCKTVGGVFTFLWHNHTLLDPDLRWLYEQLLDVVSGVRTYDWKAELRKLSNPVEANCRHSCEQHQMQLQ